MFSIITFAHLFLSLLAPSSVAEELSPPSTDDLYFVLQAAEIPPQDKEIDLNHIVLMGRGIKERRGERSLGLACVGDKIEGTEQRKCDYLRWILFTGSSHVQYVGAPLQLGGHHALKDDGEPNQEYRKAIKKYLKTLSKKSKKHFYQTHPIIMAGGLIPVVGALWVAGISAIPPMAVILGGGLILIPAGKIVGSVLFAPGMTFSSHNTVKATERDGWSWSSRPKNVSSSYFDSVISQIQ